MFNRHWVVDDTYKAFIFIIDLLWKGILVGQGHAVTIIEADAYILVGTVVDTLDTVEVDPSSLARLPHESSPHTAHYDDDIVSLGSFKWHFHF